MTARDVSRAVNMVIEGMSLREAARELNVNRETLRRNLKVRGIEYCRKVKGFVSVERRLGEEIAGRIVERVKGGKRVRDWHAGEY